MGGYETQIRIILIKNLIYNLTDHIFTYTLMAAVSVETLLYSVLRIVIKKSIWYIKTPKATNLIWI